MAPASRRTPRSRACSGPTPPRNRLQRVAEPGAGQRGAIGRGARGGRRTASRSRDLRDNFRDAFDGRPRADSVDEVTEASEESFPASDAPGYDAKAAARSPPADARAGVDRLRPRLRPVRSRWTARRFATPLRLGAHRRDHQLHEHLEPERHGRRRDPRPAGGRARPAYAALGQDLACTGLARGHRLPGRCRPHGSPASRSASTWSATAARPALATPARSPSRSLRRSRPTSSSVSPSSPGTATSRAGSIRWPGRLPCLPAAGRGVRARGTHRPGPHDRAARHRSGRRPGLPRRPVAHAAGGGERSSAERVRSEIFTRNYASVFDGDERWAALPVPAGDRYAWDPESHLRGSPAVLRGTGSAEPAPCRTSLEPACWPCWATASRPTISRRLAAIARTSPGRAVADGARRRSAGLQLATGRGAGTMRSWSAARSPTSACATSSPRTRRATSPSTSPRAANDDLRSRERYAAEETPLIVLAGREYGSGSSRDWAAKGPYLQGVRAVIAESYERIHRSNLVGMGILPLQYLPGENAETLGLTGRETFTIDGIVDGLRPRQELTIRIRAKDGSERRFRVVARLDGEVDVQLLHERRRAADRPAPTGHGGLGPGLTSLDPVRRRRCRDQVPWV